jgi:hypothetical protein
MRARERWVSNDDVKMEIHLDLGPSRGATNQNSGCRPKLITGAPAGVSDAGMPKVLLRQSKIDVPAAINPSTDRKSVSPDRFLAGRQDVGSNSRFGVLKLPIPAIANP